MNYETVNLNKVDKNQRASRIKKLNYRIANLANTIPSYFKTEEVMEEVADIQKEYKELIEDPTASEK